MIFFRDTIYKNIGIIYNLENVFSQLLGADEFRQAVFSVLSQSTGFK